MDKKKTTIILGICCAIVVVVAIALIASPKDKIDVDPNNSQNEMVDNNESVPQINTPIIDSDLRKDGEKTLAIVFNGKNVGDAKVIVKNGLFNVNVKDLNATGATKFEEKDGTLVWDSGRFVYTIKENSLTSFDKEWESVKTQIDSQTNKENVAGNTEEKELGAERTFEMPGFIKFNNEYYLTESVITFIGSNSYVNDKGISIVTEVPMETNSNKLEALLNTEGLIDMNDDDFKTLGKAFFDGSFEFNVESYGLLNENINNDAVKEVLFNSFNNPDNIIYSKKIDNKYIVMSNNNVASALMNTILGSVSSHDLYTNVRLIIETDNSGNITSVYGDSYYIFDGRDIYCYISGSAK